MSLRQKYLKILVRDRSGRGGRRLAVAGLDGAERGEPGPGGSAAPGLGSGRACRNGWPPFAMRFPLSEEKQAIRRGDGYPRITWWGNGGWGWRRPWGGWGWPIGTTGTIGAIGTIGGVIGERVIATPTASNLVPTIDLLVVQPTPFCNIDCRYCYLPDRNSKAVVAPADVAQFVFAGLRVGLGRATACRSSGMPASRWCCRSPSIATRSR